MNNEAWGTDTTAFSRPMPAPAYQAIEPGRADSRAFYNLGCWGTRVPTGPVKGMTMSVS